jgi:hypothetical protein
MAEKLTQTEKKEKAREWRWWKMNPEKLVNLEHAFAIGCTDKEAIGFAGISETQLYYYERLNPEFKSKKEMLKETVILKAKEAVHREVGKNYQNAIDYLKRKRRKEYGDSIDMTSENEKITGVVVEIVAPNYETKPESDNSIPEEQGS